MGSGPNTGLGEIAIPDLQPGSSIMPGKVNPVIPEAVLMVAARVVGNDATVAWAGASGSFELNVQIPVIAAGVLESVRLLANASRLLADKTVSGLVANEERARALAESSPSIVTPLNRVIGYESAAKIAKHAVKHGITVRAAVIDLGFVERGEITEEQLDSALDVLSMTQAPAGLSRRRRPGDCPGPSSRPSDLDGDLVRGGVHRASAGHGQARHQTQHEHGHGEQHRLRDGGREARVHGLQRDLPGPVRRRRPGTDDGSAGAAPLAKLPEANPSTNACRNCSGIWPATSCAAAGMVAASREVSIATIAAEPMTPPICRVVLNAPAPGTGRAAGPARRSPGWPAARTAAPVPTPKNTIGSTRCHTGASGCTANASHAIATARMANPLETTHLPATRSESRPANGATTPDSSEPGRPTSAACSGLRPRTSCRNRVNGKKMPIIAKDTAAPATLAEREVAVVEEGQGQQRVAAAVTLPEHERRRARATPAATTPHTVTGPVMVPQS